jgi:hypothetical protein
LIISRSVLLRMRKVADKSCRGNENTFYVRQLFSENRCIFMIMLKNIKDPDRPHDDIIRSMQIAYWILKATNTHPQYVILIAFPLQQWLLERASMLRYSMLFVLIQNRSDLIIIAYS